MQLGLIIHALYRNKLGAMLVCMQIALTLAIVCNSLSVVEQHLRHMVRPTGLEEGAIWVMRNQWTTDSTDLKSKELQDLAAIRSIPGVVDAAATNNVPLGGSNWNTSLKLSPTQQFSSWHTSVYLVDDHALAVYGLRLTAGRWFSADEIGEFRHDETKFPGIVILTRSLAQSLFPRTDPLGRVVYYGDNQPARIIGIVDLAQAPFTSDTQDRARVTDVSFFPFFYVSTNILYVVRTQPGRLASTMRTAQDKLFQVSAQRVVNFAKPFSEMRHDAYTSERKASVMLGVVCGLLMTVTALGVVGLTSYWVSQRTRYIGMRRALGARRRDILSYFHLENLLIAGAGSLIGIAIGVGANGWLAVHFAITRMSLGLVAGGAVAVIALCQAAILWPALRAASIPPARAFRKL